MNTFYKLWYISKHFISRLEMLQKQINMIEVKELEPNV